MSAGGRRLVALAIAALAACTLARAAGAGDALRLLPSGGDSTGAVRWQRLAPPADPPDSATLVADEPKWRAHVASPAFGPPALRRLALARLARRDTAGADSIWAALAARRSIWQWEALRGRVEIATARGDTLRADSLLGRAERGEWPDADRAAWLAWRARTRGTLLDTLEAARLARQAIRAYPAAWQTRASLATLERVLAMRGDSLDAADERAAAEVDAFRGDGLEAARRLERAARLGPPEARFAPTLRRAEVLRSFRRTDGARSAALAALAVAADSAERTRAVIERARAHRDAGRPDSAFALYAAARRTAPTPALAATAAWEWAREAEDQGRWDDALEHFRDVAALGGTRARDARFRAGLMHYTAGRSEEARAWWEGSALESSRFWWAVSLAENAHRSRDARQSARADSALVSLARQPGGSFYRAAARESLDARGWNGHTAAPRCARDSAAFACGTIAIADSLVRLGAAEEAAQLLGRAVLADARLPAFPGGPSPDEWIAMAAVLHAAGRTGTATTYADRALGAAGARSDSTLWSFVPWAYPPAYDSLFAAYRVDSLGIDLPTLLAVARQESRFDPRARSGSNALGLMQLLPSTGADVAKRMLHEKAPSESLLMTPELSIRYGSRYLAGLLLRFDRRLSVALSAYNAGPSTLPPFWRELIARGGEALFCEIASNADAQEYARRILGYRQVYRELRPTTAR